VRNTIFSLCLRDKVESVRLPESSRARTKDNSRSCTIPCCYCRWALSGTVSNSKAVSSSGKTRSGIKFAKEPANPRFYQGKKKERNIHRIIFEGSSLPANCTLDFFRSHASHNFTSVGSFPVRPSLALAFLLVFLSTPFFFFLLNLTLNFSYFNNCNCTHLSFMFTLNIT